jgi:hypothetical protein
VLSRVLGVGCCRPVVRAPCSSFDPFIVPLNFRDDAPSGGNWLSERHRFGDARVRRQSDAKMSIEQVNH